MPAAIPLAISAGTAIYGKIKQKKEQDAARKAAEAQAAAQASASSGGGGGGGGGNPEAAAGFRNFAQTGGFSPEDLRNIRARALSPVRATYANAEREVNRQRALQGGYSPGFGTLQARMAREQGQGISDAATNAESSIAQMVQQGKLAGLQGLASMGGGGGGGGGSEQAAAVAPQPEEHKGFWGKLGSALGQASEVALPIVMNAYGNGPNNGAIPKTQKLLPSRQTTPNYSTSLPGFGT